MTDREALDAIAAGLSSRVWEGAADLEWVADAVRETGRVVAEPSAACYGGECENEVVAVLSALPDPIDDHNRGGKVGEPACELHRQQADHYGYGTQFLD